MKLYAQSGYGPGEKISEGISKGFIDGAIFSPKDSGFDTVTNHMKDVTDKGGKVFFDPQYYVSLYANSPDAKLGKLEDWNYFKTANKSQLEISANVDKAIENVYNIQKGLPVDAFIMPNIYISESFDSRVGVIAKNFIRQSVGNYRKSSNGKPIYATLAVCREALLDQSEFEEFVNDITVLDDPPDGFYLIIGARDTNIKSDIYHTDVIANWMYLNHSLKINGFKVINGYSDIISPFLGAVGADGGATGWHSNLRHFSIDRYVPKRSGGRQPIIRYLSQLLMNRVTCSEKDALREFVPEIENHLSMDSEYNPEPERSREVLQSWEAIKSMIDKYCADDLRDNIEKLKKATIDAENAYTNVSGLTLDSKSRDDHLAAFQEGITEFEKLVEL